MSPPHWGHSRPRHHYKPKCQGAECEAGSTTGQDQVPGEEGKKNQNRVQRTRGPSAALGRTTRRPFRSEPPSPGGRATGRASTRARGFAAYSCRCPLAESGTSCFSGSVPFVGSAAQVGHEDPGRPPILGRAGSVQTRRRRSRRPLPTGPAQHAAAARQRRLPGPTTGPWRPDKGPVAAARPLCTPPARVHRGPVAPRAIRQDAPPSARAETAEGSGRPRS